MGPWSITSAERVWANNGVAQAGSIALNSYDGHDGQAPDPVFASSSPNTPVIGYSGLAYATGTPMQLGNSPVVPNISAEWRGFRVGTAGDNPLFALDASPALILLDILRDPRVGAGFPVDPDVGEWGQYCQASGIGFSLLMDKQQPCSHWVEELGILTTSAIFWSSGRLRVVPYALNQRNQNGATWTAATDPVYDLTDDDFLPWGSGAGRSTGEQDPVLITRADASQLVNWITVEYMDRGGWYNPYVASPMFDQASIEAHGVRTSSSIQAHEACTTTVADNVGRDILRRKLYLRNTYRFRVGWRHMLLEPMDVVTLTESVSGLDREPVRIIEVQEDEAGALTMTAEQMV